MPEPGPNRLALIKTASITLYFGLATAYELRLKSDIKLRFGGTFRVQYIDAFQRMAMIAASARLFYKPSSKKVNTGEVLLDISAQGVGFTGDLGFSLDLPLGFSIGTSVLFPVTAKLSGVLNVQLKETLEILGDVEVQGKGLEIETSFPMVFRSGVGWRGHGLVVEAAFVAEFWSKASTQKFKPKNIVFLANKKPTPIPDLEIEHYFHDSYSIRIGAEYNIKNWVWVRAGWWYETGSLKEKYLSVASIDYPNRMALTGGVSVKVPGGMMLSVSVMHILGREVKITNSPLRPTDLSPEGDLKSKTEIPSTSNGTYQFGNTTLFLGFRGNWGPGSGTRASLAEAE
jgi:long-subunit fatty acid transport protein